MRKRPPQGATTIISERQRKMAKHFGKNLADAIRAEMNDPELQKLAEAKQARDTKTMGELIPLLRKRYGDRLSKLFRSF